MDMFKIMIVLAFVFVLSVTAIFAGKRDIKLSIYPAFGDHMVLQRDLEIVISGQANPGQKVEAVLAGVTVTAKAGSDGEWKAKFPAMTAGGPYELKISSGKESITLSDILLGDVWFCSGQSNMEMRLHETTEGAQELKDFPKQPLMRLFLQGQRPSPKPITEVSGSWTACDAKYAADFSAVGYFFGKKLQTELNVPIGLIDSSWGGTSIEIWTDANLIKANKETAPIYERWKADPKIDWIAWNNGEGMKYGLEFANMKFTSRKNKVEPLRVKLSASDSGDLGGAWDTWAKPGSITEYKNITDKEKGIAGKLYGTILLGAWAGGGVMLKNGDDVDLSKYDTVEFDAKGKGKYTLSLGQKSITDFNYYTSQEFEAEPQWETYTYDLSLFGQGNWGTKMPFNQNAIMKLQFNISSVALEMPSALYHGMVVPFTRAKIKGVIWYQGENNTPRASQYKTLLPMMINNWRDAWGEKDLPFYVVQLTNFMEKKTEPSESEWAELRESQLSALTLPYTGVVSTIDIGDEKDIHPKIKKPYGDRLAAAALSQTYGKDVTPYGPMFDSVMIDGNKATVKFKYAGKGLTSKGELKGFAIAGADGVYKWAKAEIKGDTVVVWNDGIKEPKSVRYAWADSPDCTLYNQDGLAAFPFRTDWKKGITEGKY